MAAPGAFHARGWHATAVCGVFAATLVAGRLDGLDVDRLTSALGIAGSFASGVLEYLEDGSWVKRLHAGWAGHGGAVAAALARGGFTGPATILDGRFGFYRTLLGAEPDPGPFATLGREWETPGIGYKPYPCCHYNHAYLDCALELRRAHALAVEEIAAVECRVPAGEVPIVCEPRAAKLRPRTPYDAQFSLPYSVASALIDGHVGLDTYAADRLTEPRRLALAARVSHAIDAESTFPRGFPGWVRVHLRDGRVLEARVPDGRGSLACPLPSEAIVEKFRGNAARVLPPGALAQLEHAVLRLDELSDVRTVTGLCRA
jgi:2-methylcitrate dehydratase PrpD